jgi:hypothetical protein
MRFFIFTDMAKDAYWFRHDANARNDIKIIELRSLHGYEGYGLYFGILEVMREQAHYAIPENKIGMVSVALGESPQKVKQVMDDCISVGLFVLNDGLIYSPSFLERMSKWEDMKNRNESNGSKGGRPKKNPSDNPNNNPLETQNKPSIGEDIKGEENRVGNTKSHAHDIPTIDDCVQASQMSGFTKEQGEAYYHFRNANGWMVARGKDGNLFPIANWRSDMVMAISKGYLEKQQDKTKPDMKEAYKGFKPL